MVGVRSGVTGLAVLSYFITWANLIFDIGANVSYHIYLSIFRIIFRHD